MPGFAPVDSPFVGMRNSSKKRVSYFYDEDIGDFDYEYKHPMYARSISYLWIC